MSEECNHIIGFYINDSGGYTLVYQDNAWELDKVLETHEHEEFICCSRCGQFV
jgi:hypothetical protein